MTSMNKNTKIEIIRALLDDPRVDPVFDNNHALRLARRYGREDIESLLLSDSRVVQEELELAERLK